MKRTKLVAVLLVFVAALYSCAGEDGATGPRGQDGNANVIVLEYGSKTTTSGFFTYTFEASQGFVDSSLVLAYYNPTPKPANMWYPVPGLGPESMYMTRSFWWQTGTAPSTYTYETRLLIPTTLATYTTSTTFARFRIIIAPASEIQLLSSRGLLNLSDYSQVAEHFNLPE